MRFSLRTLLFALLGCAVAIASVRSLVTWADPYDNRPFQTQQWAVVPPEVRAQMCRDLLRRHLKPGMPEAALIGLLGEPDAILTGSTDAGGNRLRAMKTLSYYIGPWSLYGYDDAFLYLYLDAEDELAGSVIAGY